MLTFKEMASKKDMEMKKTALLFSMFMLSGCMASSLESQEPIYSGNSQKSIDKISKCLAPKWVELRPSSSVIPTETGYKIVASDDLLGTVSIAKIEPSKEGGSNVHVYAISKGWNDPWGKAAKSCM
ncbi:hypothetical protein NUBL22007_39290 [Klebsiella pneumoniae]|jgi:hypothetical protein|nr:hypothetical protein TUM17563_48270 [Klebsiella oxytoca]GKJ18653.1 hypothetical protein NUKP23_49500 [Klebsiella variicola]GKL65763.1 hypothetical protein NUKP61_51990 [Klebsiella variicola]GKO16822.1 hypothetical protein NUBL22007_39290 [Klebsiella pneumoniae]CDQ13868.1 Gp19 [Klebsiella quasipneumoniae subsp. quasipneumoniae]